MLLIFEGRYFDLMVNYIDLQIFIVHANNQLAYFFCTVHY
jgi:hypothetical protein